MEVHRRIRLICGRRRRWEHLLHHETVILLASVSVQRALNALLARRKAAVEDGGAQLAVELAGKVMPAVDRQMDIHRGRRKRWAAPFYESR